MRRIFHLFLAVIIFLSLNGNSLMADETKKSNRLVSEKSPYLLQHARNPVDWYPWGAEAFEKAKKENKPIFLSIGYSTCHWCHVMEKESFEDPAMAKLMNEVFVAIKVDREERPDLDNIYMTVCQMMTGSGGWPLTIIMTPDKKPFFAGTYFPRENRYGQIGMLELIPRIKELWNERRDEVFDSADQICAALKGHAKSSLGGDIDESVLKRAYEQIAGRYDAENGGFGTAPKFPSTQNIFFLLRYWKRTGDAKALEMVERTLEKMRMGGIYDQIGYGFHRYSTDSEWLVPHFEKMLYDQVLLAIAYIEAYQATGKDEYKKTAEEIFEFVSRDMTDPGGGFYSAIDADSEGEEGKFYLWTEEEIRKILAKNDADLFIKVFSAGKNNILRLEKSLQKIAAELKTGEGEIRKQLESAARKLFAAREKRVHPGLDDKILADWNGLMIAAFAKGAQVFGNPAYAQAAARAADFVLKKMRTPEGRLLHRYRDGHAAVTGNLDDYAFMIWGLLELYEAGFDERRLQTALDLSGDMIKHFWDEKDGGFYFTADDAEELIVRRKEAYDGAIPSGNSIAMLNLLRLGRLTANQDLEKKGAEIGNVFSAGVKEAPAGYLQLLSAFDFALGPSMEITIAGNLTGKDTKKMLTALNSEFLPNKVVLFRPEGDKPPAITKIAPFTKDQRSVNGKATAYVCRNYTCKAPVTDAEEMINLIRENSSAR